MNGRVQSRLIVLALKRAHLQPEDLWVEYYALGGEATQFELEAYLHAVIVLPSYERDLLADACNALLAQTPVAVRIPQSREDEPEGTARESRRALGAAGAFLLTEKEAELERLDALARTCLLDTPAEARFDRLTRQAIEYFEVSSAIVTLIDDRRMFLKSVIGPIQQNLPRNISFCTRTIQSAGPLIVPDARNDDRFKANPLVLGDPHIRFYAGYPLRGPGRWTVGTLCVIDQQPRSFTAADGRFLRRLAAAAETELAATTAPASDTQP